METSNLANVYLRDFILFVSVYISVTNRSTPSYCASSRQAYGNRSNVRNCLSTGQELRNLRCALGLKSASIFYRSDL